MVFYHKKAVRDNKLPRWNQIQNYGDTTPACPLPLQALALH